MKLAVVMALTLLLGALAPAPVAHAHCRETVNTSPTGPCVDDPSAKVLFWTRSCFTYIFNDQVFSRIPRLSEREIRDTFNQAFATWAAIDCGDGRKPFSAQQAPGVSQNSVSQCLLDTRNEALITAKTPADWTAEGNSDAALAITEVWNDKNTGEILDVDMELNVQNGRFANCDKACGTTDIDLLNTITHEAGHVLGLGHSTVTGATMTFQSHPGETSKRTLRQDDIDGYCGLDLPEHKCSGSDCACPAAPIYSSSSGATRVSSCSVGRVGAHAADGGGSLWAIGLAATAWFRRRRWRDAR
jgi:hypothetical protein